MENTIDNGNMTAQAPVTSKPENRMKRTRQRLIFYIMIMIFPLLHFLVFRIYVNFDMVAMAFSEYVKPAGEVVLVREFVGFKNFWYIIETFQGVSSESSGQLPYYMLITNSLLFYAIGWTFVPVGICFAYYIYKGYPLGNFFRIVLYLPQIMSAVVLTFLYKEIMRTVVQTGGLEMGHIILYNFWTGFGLNVIMYTGAMCGINTSISESAQLDGASSARELWSITIPMIFPTIVTFLVVGVAGILTQGGNLFSFYSYNLTLENAKAVAFEPLGYFLSVNTLRSGPTLDLENNFYIGYDAMTYPQLAMLGFMITAIVLPLALTLRHVLEKYGPSDK